MRTADFDYALPTECIASHPAAERDRSRLLRLDKWDGRTTHLDFAQIVEHIPRGSLVVLNDTRVIPARLRARKATGGEVELLLLRCLGNDERGVASEWEAIGRNLGRAPIGTRIEFAAGLVAEVRERGDSGIMRVLLCPPRRRSESGETVFERILGVLNEIGELPLPPYIEAARKRQAMASGQVAAPSAETRALDRERYQTVYAANPGAVAAPTAGLHFTEDLLARVEAAGNQIVRLTLHVGLGTFRPVKVEDPEQHEMESETYVIPPATAEAVEHARRSGRPVLAIGTTVVRALESAARDGDGSIRPGTATSRLFLRPGDTFRVVTDLITNFHLPRSTLLMLVSAFAGRERILGAYAEAIASRYRFYSYGDAMLIRGSR